MRGTPKPCTVDGCDRPLVARGLCNGHYQRMSKTGSVAPDLSFSDSRKDHHNANWRGGKTKHPHYLIYHDMVRRCTNPRHARYSDYGGRGISVHTEWVEDFWKFVEDVGPRPDERKTKAGRAYWQLDRVDNNGNYEPGNVRWATPFEQRVNTRDRRRQVFCRQGHEMTEENTYTNPNSGATRCRECGRRNDRNRKSRRGKVD